MEAADGHALLDLPRLATSSFGLLVTTTFHVLHPNLWAARDTTDGWGFKESRTESARLGGPNPVFDAESNETQEVRTAQRYSIPNKIIFGAAVARNEQRNNEWLEKVETVALGRKVVLSIPRVRT